MPDWEKSWEIISRRALPNRRPRFRAFGRPWAWAYAAAAFLAVFILGYYAGRRILPPVPETALPSASFFEPDGFWPAFADSLEPVLTDFLNRGDAPLPSEIRELREKSIRTLIADTRLLKKQAGQSGDEEMWRFLDELENVLVSLSNLKPGDRESADLLDRMIRERQMRSKLRELSGVKITL